MCPLVYNRESTEEMVGAVVNISKLVGDVLLLDLAEVRQDCVLNGVAPLELHGVTPLDELTGDTGLDDMVGVTPLDNLNGETGLDDLVGVTPLLEFRLGYLPSRASLDSQEGDMLLLTL